MSKHPEVNEALIHLHGYQPLRGVSHEQYAGIHTSPDGIDWTKKANDDCYAKLAAAGLLNQVSFNIFGTLEMQLETINPKTVQTLNSNTLRNEIGSPITHQILPDLNREEKEIVIGAGVKRYKEDHKTRKGPRVGWAAETALDTETLSVFAEQGFEAVFGAAHQVRIDGYYQTDNVLTRVRLPNGKSIVVIAADRNFSGALGFEDKSNADRFFDKHIEPAFRWGWKGPLTGITDMETFGLHMPNGDKFLEYLVNTVLPSRGIQLITTEDLDLGKAVDGRLTERSAWSCHCGNLVRWGKGCSCTGPDNSWKEPFYSTFKTLLRDVTDLVKPMLGRDFVKIMINDFERGIKHKGPSRNTTPTDSLLAAYAAALVGRTSCATFYGDPGTSGGPQILFGHSATQHLRDAGLLKDAERIESRYRQNLREIHFPHDYNHTAETMLEWMLNQRTVRQLAPALLHRSFASPQ